MVLGDLILDQYIWGDVERISPEAPIPVVWAKRQTHVPGGAANVASNIRSLGAKVGICGVVGNDHNSRILLQELKKAKINTAGVFSEQRYTTVKTRIVAGHQQVVRLDWEHTHPLNNLENKRLFNFIKKNLDKFDVLIVEDYGKGVINPSLLKQIIKLVKARRKIITVDPKEEHFQYYEKVSAITPNRKETECALRYLKIRDRTNSFKINTDRLLTDKELNQAGKALLKHLKLDCLLITMGEKGMQLFEADKITRIPTVAVEVFDVSGAGDTVIATFSLALASGASRLEAAHLANFAAGIVVGKIGTATASKEELLDRIGSV